MTPELDDLYRGYSRTLYKITGEEGYDSIMDVMQADASANNSTNVQTSASDLGGGTSSASTTQATGAASQQGKQTFTDTQPGYILGFDPADGKAKFLIGNSTNYLSWDGSTLTVVGGASVSSIDIPDTTTTASMHVDNTGNTWWGANVASGLSAANASITSSGVAVFKSISIGGNTTQYQITNSGIFSFGDGSDGPVTFDGSTTVLGLVPSGSVYTLTRDIYVTSLTLNIGVTIEAAGWRIFASGTLTVNGTIDRSGNDGGGGFGDPTGLSGGGTGGAATPDGYLKGSPAGGGGGHSINGTGADGTAVSNSIGASGVAGASGGAPAGAAGAATASNVKLIANWHLATLLDISSTGSTVKFTGSASSSGGGGSPPPGASPGGGGGGASPGAIIAIYARSIVIGATGVIQSNGGNGGDGAGGCGSGGGGGGSGGVVVLVYNNLTNSGSITANAGTGGVGGFGSNGSNGNPGVIYEFQISL